VPDVSIILPTRNEAQTVGRLLDEIKELPFDKEVLVVDYRSTDGTREIVLEKGVTLIDEEEQGKGTALIRGFKEASGKYVIVLDADGTYLAGDIEKILEPLRGGYGAVLGWRRHREKGAMFWGHRLGNYALSFLASILYLHRVRDINTGMKGFRKYTLSQLTLTSKDFTIEADIFINLVKGEHPIKETPIRYKSREKGSLPKLSIWDGFKIGLFLVRRRFN